MYFFSFFLFMVISDLAVSASSFQNLESIALTNSNFDTLIQDRSKPWFILACDQNQRCRDLKPTWERLVQDYSTQLNLGFLQMKQSYKIVKRLSIAALPSFLYSSDGVHFIPYYWPREYEDLVQFIKQGHLKVPAIHHRLLDPPTFRLYLYQSALYFLEKGNEACDKYLAEIGLGDWTSVIKGSAIIGVTSIGLLTIWCAIYSFVKEQIQISKLSKKKHQ